MARRRTKRRTHAVDVARQNPAPQNAITAKSSLNAAMSRTPKTMVIRAGAGEVGSSVTTLVRDVRRMMEPYTASRLKERKSNKLKDYTVMAGPLGVTQLLVFSKTEGGHTNLRMLRTPRGPTIHFRVQNYSLCKDIRRSQRQPRGGAGKEFLTPPLLVMNNFTTPSERPLNHELLTTSMFQSLFPAISAQRTPLSSIRRVLLLNRQPAPAEDPDAYILELRHYAITTKSVGAPRAIRKLNRAKGKQNGGLPNLGKLEDISDFLLDPSAAGGGYTSESEVETDAEVEVTAPIVQSTKKRDAGRSGAEKRAVKLHELGPRMKLQMTKIEEGINDGKVLWHGFVHKSKEEERLLEAQAKARQRLKDQRRKEQEGNVEKKKQEREEIKAAKKAAKKAAGASKNGEEDKEEEEEDGDEEDELEKEVGWSGDEEIWSDDDEGDEDSDSDAELEHEGQDEDEEEEDEDDNDVEME